MDYTIKQGDTLSNIAAANNTDTNTLASLNSITDPNFINAGQTIKIPKVTSNLPVSQMGVQSAMQTPAPQQTIPANTYQPAVDQTVQASQSFLDQFQQPQNQYVQERQGLLSQLASSMGLASQKAQEQQGLETQYGVTEKRQLVQDLSNAILSNQANVQARQLSVGKFGDTTQGQATLEEARYEREGAIKKLNLSAQLAAAQGNLALAESNIQKAISTKYDAIDNQIKNIKDYLTYNQQDLEREDKKAYDDQQLRLKEYERKIADQKAQDEAIQKIAIAAGGYGANSAIISRITNAKNVNEAIANATGYLSDPLDKEIKKKQLDKIYADIKKTNAEADKLKEVTASTTTEQGGSAIASDALSIANDILTNEEYINASGRSLGRRGLEASLVGATDYTNLDALATSLKNKLLVVNTPADVKKYFGPQMTESDVRNILSVSTSLDTEKQSPDALKKELIKIRETLQKATGATGTGGEEQVVNGITYVKGADGLYYPKQ